MTGFPRGLESQGIQHVEPAVVAADCKELRRRGPRDSSNTET
jgi:hypothetical protein